MLLLVGSQLSLQVARQLSLLVARQLLLLVARQLLLQVARQLSLLVGRQMSLQVGRQSKDTTTTEALSLFPIRNHEHELVHPKLHSFCNSRQDHLKNQIILKCLAA